jgi:PH domain
MLLASPFSAQGSPGILSPLPPHGISAKARKVMGLRAISDAVTGSEKTLVTPTSNPSPVMEGMVQSPARTGSSTPSVTSKSLEIDNTDTSSKGTDGPVSLTNLRALTRPKAKSKKETSAYTRGLQKLSPAEQRIGCDHSGWMKKKSSSLVTTWKPRLFILRGRRLSYYYSENDQEERGVIDISSHKVLVANQDPITTLHATITGATSTASPSSNDSTSKLATEKGATSSHTSISSTPFYFKLVPPKTGLSRAVQFTKPAVHYFQVDSLAEGRKWMGEMMKATIEHSMTGFETTNKQKTISLAKARARKDRPLGLKEAEVVNETKAEQTKDGSSLKETGLNIRGLSFDGVKKQEEPPSSGHEKMSSLDTGRKSAAAAVELFGGIRYQC